MALHRLTHIVMGVPNVEETAAYYAEFGLIPGAGGDAGAGAPEARTFATVDGGEQLTIVHSPRRQQRWWPQYQLPTHQRLAGFATDSVCKSRISMKRLQIMKVPQPAPTPWRTFSTIFSRNKRDQ